MTVPHGTILGGLSTVPDLDRALHAYRDVLGLELEETGALDADLAESWGSPGNSGSRYAMLRPGSGEDCWFRLVEQPDHESFIATTTFGWAAFECAVQDARSWRDKLPGELFEIRGLPRTPSNLAPTFIAMQVLGPGKEMFYFNQALDGSEDVGLHRAKSPLDRIFIAVLATQDRSASAEWYCRKLGLQRGENHTLAYSMINLAFGRPDDALTTLTMLHHAGGPVVEVDEYPAAAQIRPQHEGMLPPGNALVTLAVRSLGDCDANWLSTPAHRKGSMYLGRRSATTIGPAGELVECIEI